MSGSITITPGKQFSNREKVTTAKLNQAAAPTGQVDQDAITDRELSSVAVTSKNFAGKSITLDHNGAAIGEYKSVDYVGAIFTDGVGTVGSPTFTSATAQFTSADNGRIIQGYGIPAGTTITYVNGTTITLSRDFMITYVDGVISGTTILDSPSAAFTPSDNGRTIVGDGIPDGTTIVYVSATQVNLSNAATNGTDINFHVVGRPVNGKFTIIGRGNGFRFYVDANGIGNVEIYRGAFFGSFASGTFSVGDDGSLSLGTDDQKLAVTKEGDFVFGSGDTSLGITHDGKMWIGGPNFSSAIVKISNNGAITVREVAGVVHNMASGTLNPAVADVTASPSGGAVTNPTPVALTCATTYRRIYYRLTPADGVTNGTKTFTSAGGAFTPMDVGKAISGQDIPAGAYIEKWNSATSIDLSAAATGTHTGISYAITPNQTDTLYVDGTPITLTATRQLTARAYKSGEYSALLSLLFTLDSTTVPNPTFSPGAGPYGGGAQDVTIADALAGAAIFYTLDGTTPTHDGSGNATGTAIKIAPASGVTPPSGIVHLMTGITTIKALAWKSGVGTPDSGVETKTYTITASGGGSKVAAPVCNPAGFESPGHGAQTVNISSTSTGTINMRYTKDGTTPTRTHGTLISSNSGSTSIPANFYKILQVIAYDTTSTLADSDVTTEIYDFT